MYIPDNHQVEPKTAAEALKAWRESKKWIDDPESGERPEDLFEAAFLTVDLAKTEELSLDQLVPDKIEREDLHSDYEACLELHDDFA